MQRSNQKETREFQFEKKDKDRDKRVVSENQRIKNQTIRKIKNQRTRKIK